MDLFNRPEIIWLIAGILLLLLEFAIPGMIIIFLGFGALFTAVLTYFTGISVYLQFLSFALFSILFIVLLRKKFINMLSGKSDSDNVNEFVGQRGVALDDIPASQVGVVIFRGSKWDATSNTNISKGMGVIIIDKKGAVLTVKPESRVMSYEL